jgi:hypothetical protein
MLARNDGSITRSWHRDTLSFLRTGLFKQGAPDVLVGFGRATGKSHERVEEGVERPWD